MSYKYKMVQVPQAITVSSPATGDEAANYLQGEVDKMAESGWEFYRIDPISVSVQPGCLQSLMGQKASYTTYHVITFKQEA